MSSAAATDVPTSPWRNPASDRLVHHALAAAAANLVGAAAPNDNALNDNAAGAGRRAGCGIGGHFNPVVIVGPAGSGKSRLVSEWFVRQTVAAADAGKTAVFWDGRSLARDLTAALSQNTIDRLHERFVASRLIVVDAVEQITAWDAQRTLSHLFDAATAVGTTFLATLRIHPIACTALEPSLASRLAGGLVVSMPPVGTTRYDLGSDAAGERRTPSLRRVINATARWHGLTSADLCGPDRCRQVSQARGMAMYLARRLTPESLQTIGRAFGGRDHTTVMHGIRVTERRRSSDPGVTVAIDEIVAALVGR